jgi:hypothetical protein
MSVREDATPWVRLPTVTISPFRTYQISPSKSRIRVTRRPDVLDGALDVVDLDDVAHPVLILEDQEEAGEQVLDQALGAEGHRDADDSGRGQDRRQPDADRVEAPQHGHGEDEGDADVVEQPADRRGALGLSFGVEAGEFAECDAAVGGLRGAALLGPSQHPADDPVDALAQQPAEQQGGRDDDRQVDGRVRPVPGEGLHEGGPHRNEYAQGSQHRASIVPGRIMAGRIMTGTP